LLASVPSLITIIPSLIDVGQNFRGIDDNWSSRILYIVM